MSDKLKDTIEKSRHHLSDLIDKIEDGFESVADESAELWDEAKPRLKAMKDFLQTGLHVLLLEQL